MPVGWAGRLLGLGLLGGLQGAVGWWMVSSGLSGSMLDVASYRLATHLGLAFVILGLIAWYVFLLGRDERDLIQARRFSQGGLCRLSNILLGFAFVQILLGALVAGIDAGRTYNDWPLMAGAFLPPYPFELEPLRRNFFENAGLVQFMHRIAGYGLVALGLYIWVQARRSSHIDTRFRFNALIAVLLLQLVIGILTVLYMAPWEIAIVHQVLASVAGRLSWDQEAMMPRGASTQRSEELATMASMIHARRTDSRVGEWLAAIDEKALDQVAQAQIRHIRREFDRATRVPGALEREIAVQSSRAHAIWAEARADDDFSAFAPTLTTLIDLRRQ
ncbi:unnamed protein product, partial [Cyprideis torosa]